MAAYGLIGDIHGNLHALQAVLDECDRLGVDRVLCLGDIVGYNADSNECIAALEERGIPSIAGNHDLISIRKLGFSRCANRVIYSLRQTRRTLTARSRRKLAALPSDLVIEKKFVLIHGGVDDVEYYMRTRRSIGEQADLFRNKFPTYHWCFFGHIHVQTAYRLEGESVAQLPIKGTLELDGDKLHFINPGSVDGSRKRNPGTAEFAVLDSEQQKLEFRQVAYDHEASESRAAAHGYRISPTMARLYRLVDRAGNVGRRLGILPPEPEELDE